MGQADEWDQFAVYRAALRQIERLAAEKNAMVMINGQRMTPERAIMLIADWAQQGVTATEIMLCELGIQGSGTGTV